MGRVLGNPHVPCGEIERSRGMIATIEREARLKVEAKVVAVEEVDSGLAELKADTAKTLGGACSQLCPKYGRCILESFGIDDPLLRKTRLTPDEQREIAAKKHFDMLRLLTERALGIALT